MKYFMFHWKRKRCVHQRNNLFSEKSICSLITKPIFNETSVFSLLLVPKHPLGGDESWARLICHQNVTRLPLPQACNRNRNCWTFVYNIKLCLTVLSVLLLCIIVCQPDLSGGTTGTWRSGGQRLQRRRQITRASNEASRRFHNHGEGH